MRIRFHLIALFLISLAMAPVVVAQPDVSVEEMNMQECRVLPRVGRFGRNAIQSDAVLNLIASDQWTTPVENDIVFDLDGNEQTWTSTTTDENGWLQHRALRGGYALWNVHVDKAQTMILHARGHGAVRVNDAWRTGDPYNTGFVRLPVSLHAGENTLLFHVSRGRLKATLKPTRAAAQFNRADMTLPDLITDMNTDVKGAVIVMNNTAETMDDLRVIIRSGDMQWIGADSVPRITRHAMRKVPFTIRALQEGEHDVRSCTMTLETASGTVLDSHTFDLRIRTPEQKHVRTFISAIDNSVQYYAITPATIENDTEQKRGLVLSLHGASVQARRQAFAYSHKTWCDIVAPTNRRPFGFDWEDWGRIDAMEVLNLVQRERKIDPSLTRLTGHSMGGHGTWNLGATYPDRFAALAPSAGWSSFWSYTGSHRYSDDDPMEAILRRATNGSDTLGLSENYLQHGIYILHGDADDNVPVEQARLMRTHLATFHPDFACYERPGAGHWWGNQCMDWPELMSFLERRTITPRDSFSFTTANPGVSSRCQWISIESQEAAWEFSRIGVDLNRTDNTLAIDTTNIDRFSIDVAMIEDRAPLVRTELTLTCDGQHVDIQNTAIGSPRWWFENQDDKWVRTSAPSNDLKSPLRSGAFKDVFRHNAVLVYGTRGREEVRDWAYDKARFDAETFWYRGNGSFELIADRDFEPEHFEGRNIVLYGNTRTNSAWSKVFQHSPVHVGRDGIRVGELWHEVEHLGAMFIRPRDDEHRTCIGAVTGTSLHGMRLTDRLPYFVSGVGYPDLFVVDPALLTDGLDGIWCAGYFGNDWSVGSGDFVWKDNVVTNDEH